MQELKGIARPRGTDGARIIKVIETRALEGRGTEEDPTGIITQYWSLDGVFLANRFEKKKE